MTPSFKNVAEIRVFVAFLANKATILQSRKIVQINFFDWNSGKKNEEIMNRCESVSVKYLFLFLIKKITSWFVLLYDFYYLLVVKDR